jgi:alpha-glucosidase (family GH31 glycosyl hydrolase)
MNLESLKLVQSSPSKVIFDAGSGYRLVIEPHAPGMYRIRFGAEASVSTDAPVSGRAKLHADLLVARPEAIFEMETESLPAKAGWRLVQGDTTLLLGQSPFSLSLSRGDRVLLSLCEDGIGYDDGHWSFGFPLKDDESVYGLGQTLTDLNRRGEYIVSDDPTHHALPFAWSPSGWGIYVNTMGRVDHDVAQSDSAVYEVHAQALALDLFLLAGDPCEMLNQYTALTGRAGQPSLWALGAWLKQPPNCTLTELMEKVQHLRALGVCLDTVMLRAPMAWRFQDAKLGIEWDSSRFPDPKQVLELFANRSIQVCLPTLPAIEAGTDTFEELEDRGWLLTHDSGQACVFKGNEVTDGKDFGLLDLTHRDVYQQWIERHRQLAEEGVSAVRCDVPFEIPDDVTARGGETGSRLQVLYPMLVRQSLYEACAGHKVPPEGVVLTGDLVPAAQRFPWQAPVSVAPTWEGMRQTIAAALSVGASGVPVQMHGIGHDAGQPNNIDTELYLRWLAMAVFSGNVQFENAAELDSPQWDDSLRDCFSQWMQWRYRLVPYVLGAVEDAARTGLPVQRSMAMCFAGDQEAHRWDSQYLLGPALLVAPLTKPGRLTQVYLPAGEAWWVLSTGWRYEGGAVLEMDVGLDRLPVFGREGHMLCLGPVAPNTSEFNSARILDEVWMFGMPVHNPVVMRNKIRVMQMQGSSYIKGLEGLKILPSEGLEVKRRGAEVRISRAR